MGRTVAPFSQILEAEFDSWNKFRRALRREDQEAGGQNERGAQ